MVQAATQTSPPVRVTGISRGPPPGLAPWTAVHSHQLMADRADQQAEGKGATAPHVTGHSTC